MDRRILLIFIGLSVTVDFTASHKEFKSSLSALDDGFCRALSFEGGGDKAAYEAGVLQGFIEGMSSPQDYAYDVVSGVSTGSINAMAFALFKKGEEKKVSEKLKETWESIKTSDVLQSWPWGIIQGVFYKGSIYDNSPFKTFLEKFAEGYQLQRQVYISAADANTAEYVVFDGSEMENTKELADAVFASSSIPGIFPPTELHGRTLIDGGTIWNINVFSAIEGCRRKGFADDKIIVDVVMNSYAEIDTNKDVSDFGALDMFFRYLDINQYYKVTDYITMLPLDYPDINVRYVVHPSSPLYSGITINFDHDQLVKIEEIGKQDALNAIKLGSKKNLEVFSNYIKQYKGNQEFTESYQTFYKRQTAQHLG